jgi:AcrR family transcriptional regulator
MAPNTSTSSTVLPGSQWWLSPPAVAPPADRAALTDIALRLFRWRGYDSITVDQIAATAGVTAQDFARYFATKDDVILSLAEEILHAGVASLARVAPNGDPLDALFIVHTDTLTAIANGVGIMTRDRLVVLARVLTAHRQLRQQIRALRRRVLTIPLAEHTSVAPDDRRMRLAFTVWAAIVTGSYNYFGGTGLFDRAGVGPSGDGRAPEAMVQRLKETFAEVTGREPPRQGIDWASAPGARGA